jgi:hypothetical protein
MNGLHEGTPARIIGTRRRFFNPIRALNGHETG